MAAALRVAPVLATAGALLLTLLGSSATALDTLRPYSASYRLEIDGLDVGRARISLRQQGQRWIYSHHSEGRGLLSWFSGALSQTESSRFELHGGRPRPLVYRYERRRFGRDRQARLEFHWSGSGEGRVTNEVADSRWHMDVPAGALDKLLVRLAVSRDLAAGARTLSYAVADGGRLKHYHFVVEGEDTVEVAAGNYRSLRLRRLREDDDRETLVWLAPALDHLPVRLRQDENEDGTTYTTELLETDLAPGQ